MVLLDNHFSRKAEGRSAIYGVDMIETIRVAKPHTFIVLMSSKGLLPDMVKTAINNKIEFFLGNPASAEDIKETLRKIHLVREREARLVGDVLAKTRSALEGPESLLGAILRAMRAGSRPAFTIDTEYLGSAGEQVLLEPMRLVARVAVGDTTTFTSTVSRRRKDALRIDSKYGLSMTLGDKSVFASVVGAKVKGTLESELAVDWEEEVETTHERALTVTLDESDRKKGAYSKELYEGLVYERHLVRLTLRHGRSGLAQSCELSCLVPVHWTTAVRLLSDLGTPILDERKRFSLWDSSSRLLAEMAQEKRG